MNFWYSTRQFTVLTGLLAARNLLGEKHDLWQVNTERSYYEEFTVNGSPKSHPPSPAPRAKATGLREQTAFESAYFRS